MMPELRAGLRQVLAAVTDGFALWRSHRRFGGAFSFAFRLRRLVLHAPPPTEGTRLHCYLRTTGVTPRSVLADSQVSPEGKISPVPGTEKLYPCTGVIIAVSQGAESNLVRTTKELDTSRSGLLTVDEDGHTSRPGVFAAGDAASGARTVVEAVANSKRVAEAMHQYMQSLPMPVTTDYPDIPTAESIEASAQAEQSI
jgi:glutamate synthase (NADPH/NADH) small chain